jgi:hypothetical protein
VNASDLSSDVLPLGFIKQSLGADALVDGHDAS